MLTVIGVFSGAFCTIKLENTKADVWITLIPLCLLGVILGTLMIATSIQ